MTEKKLQFIQPFQEVKQCLYAMFSESLPCKNTLLQQKKSIEWESTFFLLSIRSESMLEAM